MSKYAESGGLTGQRLSLVMETPSDYGELEYTTSLQPSPERYTRWPVP